MGRKSSSTAVAKTSSASAPAVSSGTSSTQKSSVLRSAFAPSNFQLHLFASVIQSFDSHQLRIHDTDTGRLRCQHETTPAVKITCLDWGYYGAAFREQRQASSKKKRKRDQDNVTGAVIAYGTNTSEICMFSPSEGKIVGTLSGVHEKGVKDFRFSHSNYLEAWSIGGDGKLVQWDLSTNKPIRTITLPDPAISILAQPAQISPQILCASTTPFAIGLKSSDDFRIDRYDSFKNAVHSLLRSDSSDTTLSEHFIAADSDRYINVYDIPHKKLVRTLVAGAGVVEVDLSSPSQETPEVLRPQILCAVLKDGSVELFPRPFGQPKQVNGDLKSSRKNLTQKASASVKLVNPGSESKRVPVVAACLRGPDLVIASADGGVDLAFQKIRWQDEGNGELLFDGVKEVVKVKSASTLNHATLNGVKDMGKTHVDESKTVVVNGAAGGPVSNAIEISSSEGEDAEEEDDDDDEEDEEDEPTNQGKVDGKAEANGADVDDESSEEESDEEMADATDANATTNDGEDEDASDAEEPTFGELLSSKHPNEISIASALPDASGSSLKVKKGQPVIPSGMSLGTVLTQALRTNDQSLLEACLHTLDINIVKNTIQRLDSGLAGILLSRLAERLASRPGRYGHLITWVQWTCIAHGGAIAAQPDVTAKLRTLYQVLTQRSKTLDNLLLLKGKLDMLDAQLSYRKQLAAQRPARRDDQDEPGMIYIEGADNWDSDDDLDDDLERPTKRAKSKAKAGKKSLEDLIGAANSGEEDDDDIDMPDNEEGEDESEDEDEDEEDDDEDEDEPATNGHRAGLVDIEAEVSSVAEDSDPDDDAAAGADNGSSSDDVSSSGSDDDDDVDEDEDDSELDSFINDGSVDFDNDQDEVHVPGDSESEDEQEDVPQVKQKQSKPAPEVKRSPKKSKKRV
ncbi:hypothetical protein A1O1_07811 [Capronia coronata CBS 617.96]|uniref:Small-subunit processome Utp12 domain-containing protein n=1 Tax=Capronia coronata CBS 617.96 TaxID=1182541 RepID=W9XXP0_9EURO|nr:uncharacterized protein A1O1_07811 [Capronia coronata CBS 617.96]EXJ81746.1 hypothetical protein A1O1_07811 [Capronia coronata CBS 617.96]